MPPKMLMDEKEVARSYNAKMSEEECHPLSHRIDTKGSCHCGYIIEGRPTGNAGHPPNRSFRRRMSSFKKERYVMSDAERARLEEERKREETRREVRKLARLPGRQAAKDKPVGPVSLLAGSKERSTKDD